MASLLPLALREPRFLAFEAVVQRLAAIDLSVLDIYNLDTVDASALFDLADQFNVLGLRGWTLARNETERRQLIKEAIQLHRTAGTPFAIKRVLTLVGYPNATILENPGNRHDGAITHDGTATHSGASFGAFVVTLDPEQSTVSPSLIDLIVALINEWKNARSYLLDLRIGNVSLFANLLLHDGTVVHDGSETHDGVKQA